jgi:DNA gyrase subunit A
MDLDAGDLIVGVEAIDPADTGLGMLTVTEFGYGKRTEPEEYRLQSRGGKGIITMKTTDKTGFIIGTRVVTDSDDLMIITDKGQTIRIRIAEIRSMGRNTQGVRVISVNSGEVVVGIEHLADREEEEEGKQPLPAPVGNGSDSET